MGGPEALDLQPCSVGETDESTAVVVDGELRGSLGLRRIGHIADPTRSELRAGHTAHADRLGPAHHPPRGVEQVDTHIPEGAASLLDEAGPTFRDTAAAHAASAGIVDVAKLASG